MSANPYWSCPAEEFPPSGVIALFDTAKDEPELVITVQPVAVAFTGLPAANDCVVPPLSLFVRAMTWLRGTVAALVAQIAAPRALPAVEPARM